MIRTLALMTALAAALPAAAQTAQEQATFTVSVFGLTAGKLTMASTTDAGSYAVSSRAASAGLAGLFSSFEVTSKVSGRQRRGALQPARYTLTATGAREGRSAEMTWARGVPTVITMDAEREPGAPIVDPAKMGGTVDPLTAMFAVLRTVPKSGLCKVSVEVFDGHRHSRITTRPGMGADGLLRCEGTYRRLDGYPPQDLADHPTSAFSVIYAPTPDGLYAVADVTIDSHYGNAHLTRD